jgi:hypothetical protein
MAKTKNRRVSKAGNELDSVYLLKLVMYLIIGAQWVRFENTSGLMQIPIPVGLLIGLAFAWHDHFKIDRKIEYALLLTAMLVGFWSQVGVYVRY